MICHPSGSEFLSAEPSLDEHNIIGNLDKIQSPGKENITEEDIIYDLKINQATSFLHEIPSTSALNSNNQTILSVHQRNYSQIPNTAHMGSKTKRMTPSHLQSSNYSQQQPAFNEVNMNKYLRGNIKKMKINGSNYAQLVNFAKSKFTS